MCELSYSVVVLVLCVCVLCDHDRWRGGGGEWPGVALTQSESIVSLNSRNAEAKTEHSARRALTVKLSGAVVVDLQLKRSCLHNNTPGSCKKKSVAVAVP